MQTTPIVGHSLCGALVYTGTYEDQTPDASLPIKSYDPVNKQFTAESDDATLGNTTKQYQIHAEFVTYSDDDFPTVSVADNIGDIEFGNSCGVATIVGVDQTDITPGNSYDSLPMVFNLNQFTTDPPSCAIVYSCELVVGADGSGVVGCGDFTNNLNI